MVSWGQFVVACVRSRWASQVLVDSGIAGHEQHHAAPGASFAWHRRFRRHGREVIVKIPSLECSRRADGSDRRRVPAGLPDTGSSGGLLVGFDVICASGGGGPDEAAGCRLVEVPAWVLLELVVVATYRTEVATAGQAALVVRLGVVGITAPSRLTTSREPAGQISQVHELAEPGRNLVRRAGLGVGASTGVGVGGCPCGRLVDCLPRSGDDRGTHFRDVPICALDTRICRADFICAEDDGDAMQQAAGLAGAGPSLARHVLARA